MITHDTEYCTVREAATALRVSVPTVWRWIRSGRLPADRIGSRSIRIKRADLDRMIKPLNTDTTQRASELMNRLAVLHERILARRGGKPLPSSVEIIRQMREERSEQL
jgi:excisionase family DNA binding protein